MRLFFIKKYILIIVLVIATNKSFCQTITDGGKIGFSTDPGAFYSGSPSIKEIIVAKGTTSGSLTLGNRALAICKSVSVLESDYIWVTGKNAIDWETYCGFSRLSLVPICYYADTTRYYMRVVNGFASSITCLPLESNILKITVKPIIGGVILAQFNACSDSSSVHIQYTPTYYLNPPRDPNSTYSYGDSTCVYGNYSAYPPFVFTWEKKVGNNWIAANVDTTRVFQTGEATNVIGPGTYRRKVTDSIGQFAYSNEVKILVEQLQVSINPPNLTLIPGQSATQLQANAIITIGLNSSLNTAFVYQWQKNSDTTTNNWTNITGATQNLYTPPNNINMYYRCVIKNSNCAANNIYYTSPSKVSILTNSFYPGKISFPFSIINYSNTTTTINSDSLASGGSGGYTYSWFKNDNGTWQQITGATSPTCNFATPIKSTLFHRKVTDVFGNSSFSNIVTIKIQFQPLKGGIITNYSEKINTLICPNSDAAYKNQLLACGGCSQLSYSWEKIDTNGNWVSIPNATNPTHCYIPNTLKSLKIRRKVMDSCNNIGYSNISEIIVYPTMITGNINPAIQKSCINDSKDPEPLILDIASHNVPADSYIYYQWQSSDKETSGFVDIAGATNKKYYPPKLKTTKYYRLKVISTKCGNVTDYTNVAMVEVLNCITGKIILKTR